MVSIVGGVPTKASFSVVQVMFTLMGSGVCSLSTCCPVCQLPPCLLSDIAHVSTIVPCIVALSIN